MARKEASPLPLAAPLTFVLALGVFLAAGGFAQRPSGTTRAGAPAAVAAAAVQRGPLAFEPTGHGGYRTRGAGYDLFVDGSGSRLLVRGKRAGGLDAQLVGARRGSRALAGDKLPTVVNRYGGSDPSKWQTGIATYGRVTYRGVYPGIDLRYHGARGQLEYDFVLAPNAEPGRVAFDLHGASSIRLAGNGDLLATVAGATLRQHRPLTYQVIHGRHVPVSSRFVLDGRRVRFSLGRYDRSRPVVIDPSLAFGDYVGGSGADNGGKVAVDSAGNMYLAATSASASIPGGATVKRAKSGARDAFVMKIAPDGTRLWITYLGGSKDDSANDVAVDGSGRPVVVGQTSSDLGDFPVAGSSILQSSYAGGARDAFVTGLAADGSIRWSTLAGTTAADTAGQVAVTPSGNAYVALNVETLTAQGAPIPPMRGYAYVFDSTGTAIWNFAQGDGTGDDTVDGVAPLPGCDATDCETYITGHTLVDDPDGAVGSKIRAGYIYRWNFHTALQVWYTDFTTPTDDNHDGILEWPGGEWPAAAAVDPSGNAVVIGTTHVGTHDWVFLSRFGKDTDNQGVIIDTPYMQFSVPPLNGDSFGSDVATDAEGNIYGTGTSLATNGSGLDAVQPKNGGAYDAAVFKYFPDGQPARAIDGNPTGAHPNARIVWATALGGVDNDFGLGVVTDGKGGTYVSGEAGSAFLPSPNQPLAATPDAFVVRIQTNGASITDGPSGTVKSRDATFKYSSGETGGTYMCRLITPASASPAFSDCNGVSEFKGLADGNYTFEVKAWDSGGTTNGGLTSRAFTVDTSPVASFTIAPNPALAGRSVAFDGSASVASTPITKYEWDLDGNGSFETDGGGTATRSQVYPAPGTFTIGLRVTDRDGRTGTTTGALQVNSAGGGTGQVGVTINNGAQFTNDPDVVVTSSFPSFTSSLLFSNDGGFGKAQTLPAQKETKWTLDSSGPERLPKTIYVRFLTGSFAGETHQDDIILDETPPKIDQAQVSPAPATAAALAARLHTFKVKVKAHDAVSGVSKIQVTANKKKPGKALKYKTKLVVKSAKRPKWVRARDRAGNWSKWKQAR